MDDFGSLNALSNLLSASQAKEEDAPSSQSQVGATLTPATLVKSQAAGTEKSKESDSKAIWDEGDVPDQEVLPELEEDDHRARPEYDINYKQQVGTNEVFFGSDALDPEALPFSHMAVKVKLPGTKAPDIDLDVKKQAIVLTTTKYRLATYLPYPTMPDGGSAKWVVDKEELQLSLPIDKSAVGGL